MVRSAATPRVSNHVDEADRAAPTPTPALKASRKPIKLRGLAWANQVGCRRLGQRYPANPGKPGFG
jgi:hypothetical protein